MPTRPRSGSICVNGREYRWPTRPLIVVCLDGSSFDYIREAAAAGAAPYLGSLVSRGNLLLVNAAMPTFTNPNNVSIVTGVPPARHGISGNFFLERESRRAVMMNDPGFLRATTIPAEFSRAGAKVVVITAKDKLRRMLAAGLQGLCLSAESEDLPLYSPALSEHVLRRGVEFMRSTAPDLMYLSTSDFVQHLHPPGSAEANSFYAAVDHQLAALDNAGATLVITADHGMNAKTDAHGQPRVVFLQTLLDAWLGTGAATVILPITDPYIVHHGALGSFATIYLPERADVFEVVGRLNSVAGIELVLDQQSACRQFELPEDRIGEIVVCADRATVLGTRSDEHDLTVLRGRLRSHGGLAERQVPMLCNHRLSGGTSTATLKNYDAFWIGLNAVETEI